MVGDTCMNFVLQLKRSLELYEKDAIVINTGFEIIFIWHSFQKTSAKCLAYILLLAYYYISSNIAQAFNVFQANFYNTV